MKKVFRMKYEPCNGDCYAWCDDYNNDVMSLYELRDNKARLKNIMERLVAIHQNLCGNSNIRYGIDLDEPSKLFIGSFLHYGKLELFAHPNVFSLIETMSDYILAHFKTDAYKEESKGDVGLGHEVCHYGEDDDLRRFIIRTSKIETPNGIDAFLEELKAA